MDDQAFSEAIQQLEDQLRAAIDNRDRGVPEPKEFWHSESELGIGIAPGAGTWDEIIADLLHELTSLREKRNRA
jgi:hypothetical protein